jgi:hypothetical protein
MSAEIQFQVAIEMDFPERIVSHVLRKHQFENAGQLVNFLEDNMELIETELEEENYCNENVVASPSKDEAMKELSLREETELLYRLSYCLKCWTNPRTLVCLPCSHYTLCEDCEKTTKTCPRRDCQASIEYVIRIYMC